MKNSYITVTDQFCGAGDAPGNGNAGRKVRRIIDVGFSLKCKK